MNDLDKYSALTLQIDSFENRTPELDSTNKEIRVLKKVVKRYDQLTLIVKG